MFGAESTTDEVLQGIDLAGKRVLITGVSAGLGVETARAALACGAYVIGTARNIAKAETACAAFGKTAADRFELLELDLASLASVRACADAMQARGEPLDIIIANAGIMACPYGRTEDGFELQFGTNHLGHFVLANRLASLLRPGGRLVNLSSRGHRIADVDLDDPNFEQRAYNPLAGYGQSKTANVLFAVEFDRRHRGRGVRATALHPGGIATGLTKDVAPEVFQELMAFNKRLTEQTGEQQSALKSLEQGAATSVWAAFVADAEAIGGQYCEDCHIADPEAGPGHSVIRAYALDPERAKALWALSERLVGETFPPPAAD